MALLNVRPTKIDQEVAAAVAAHTDRRIERNAEILTWGADEHGLLGLAAVGWLLTRWSSQPYRKFGDHMLTVRYRRPFCRT